MCACTNAHTYPPTHTHPLPLRPPASRRPKFKAVSSAVLRVDPSREAGSTMVQRLETPMFCGKAPEGPKEPSGEEAQGAGRPLLPARRGCGSVRETLPESSPRHLCHPRGQAQVLVRPEGQAEKPAHCTWSPSCSPSTAGGAQRAQARRRSCGPLWGPLSAWRSD